jgi:hypothetical protein
MAIDLVRKTIELGEDSSKEYLLAGSMFAVGHVRLQYRARFNEFFGRGLHKYTDEEKLISKLSAQGVLADTQATSWAADALTSFWPAIDCSNALALYAMKRQEWVRYFSTT